MPVISLRFLAPASVLIHFLLLFTHYVKDDPAKCLILPYFKRLFKASSGISGKELLGEPQDAAGASQMYLAICRAFSSSCSSGSTLLANPVRMLVELC
jgi:hypothetical protein